MTSKLEEMAGEQKLIDDGEIFDETRIQKANDALELENVDLIEMIKQLKNDLNKELKREKRISKDIDIMHSKALTLKIAYDNDCNELKRQIINKQKDIDNESFISDISLFSETAFLNPDEANLLVIEIISADLNEKMFPECQTLSPLTCLIIEFYKYHPVISPLFGSWNPEYKYKVNYPILDDALFQQQFEKQTINIEIHENKNGNLEILGRTTISLQELLLKEFGHFNIHKISDHEGEKINENDVIGTIHCKGKTMKPINFINEQSDSEGSENNSLKQLNETGAFHVHTERTP
eukprot:UN27828